MNERTSASPPTNIGISLLLSVFLILCLFTFSAIALVQAQNEWNNANITKNSRDNYYKAANKAEKDLNTLNTNVANQSEPLASEPIEKSYAIGQTRALEVEITPVSDETGSYYVFTKFVTVSTTEWEGDDSVNVIR